MNWADYLLLFVLRQEYYVCRLRWHPAWKAGDDIDIVLAFIFSPYFVDLNACHLYPYHISYM
jgi:hypothetical protein